MLLVYILLPTGLLALNMIVNNANVEGTEHIYNGFDMIASVVVMNLLVMFQIFSSSTIIDYLHSDINGERRWRLLAAPATLGSYIFAATVAAILFSMISGAILLLVGYFVFNAYMFNLLIVIGIMFILSLMAQIFGMFLFMFFKKKSTTEAIILVSGFAMTIAAGGFLGEINFGVQVVTTFFQEYTPFALGFRAILHTGNFPVSENFFSGFYNFGMSQNNLTYALRNLCILTAITAVMGVIVAVIARRRPL